MLLVRLAGFEPTTPWFVAKYSIQLSYRREARIITEAGVPRLLRVRLGRAGLPLRQVPAMALDTASHFDYSLASAGASLMRLDPLQ